MAAELANSPDFVTIVTNVCVFIAASSATAAAIWGAVKKIKSALPADAPAGGKVLGGLIVDHTTMLMWSESNRMVAEHLGDLRDEMRELRFTMTQLKDKM